MKTPNCVLTLLLLIGYNTAFTQVGIGTNQPKSTLEVNGSFGVKEKTISDADNGYTLNNESVLIANNSNAITIALPNTSLCQSRLYLIKRKGTGLVTIQPNGQNLIDESGTYTVDYQYDHVFLYNNGTNWIILGEKKLNRLVPDPNGNSNKILTSNGNTSEWKTLSSELLLSENYRRILTQSYLNL